MDALLVILFVVSLLAILAIPVLIARAASNRPRDEVLHYGLPSKPDRVLPELSESVTEMLEGTGFKPAWQDASILCFAESLTNELTFKAAPREPGCEVTVSGRIRPKLRRNIDELVRARGGEFLGDERSGTG